MDGEPWVSKTGKVMENWRIKHGTVSRVKAGCRCSLCARKARSIEIEKNLPKEEALPVGGMTDIGWIVLQIQAMSEDKSVPAAKRARAKWWYDRLVMADSAPATPIVLQSGGRRRSHNDRRVVASDLQWSGMYTRPLKEL
ncbi:hypothetical protein SEA_CECE_156 [Microbacterium phage Cece]|nr:hypothetical protein SEA_CECE_156 [Microbacterium phage Cece]